MPPFMGAMGMGMMGGGGRPTGGSAMGQNPGLGPSVGMSMGQRMKRRGGFGGPPGWNPQGPMPPGQGMRPPGGIGWGNPNGPGKEGNMGHPPPMGNYPRPEQGGGIMGPMDPGKIRGPGGVPGNGGINPWARPRPQMPQGRPGFGEGTGSNSRTSTDWKQRHPEDMGPMAPRPGWMDNIRTAQPQPGRVSDLGGGQYGSLENARRMQPQGGYPNRMY